MTCERFRRSLDGLSQAKAGAEGGPRGRGEIVRIYDDLAERVRGAGLEVSWLGGASPDSIRTLERLLALQLSKSFQDFLRDYGGGGVVGADISGIEAGKADLDGGGTVLGDTLSCRSRFGLPAGLAVVYLHDDEVVWCLDCRDPERRAPVVSYDVFRREVDKELAADFESFFRNHLELYSRSP